MTINDIEFLPGLKYVESEHVRLVCSCANEAYSNAFFEMITRSGKAQKLKNGKWEFLTDEEIHSELETSDADLRRKCMLALNGFVVRKDNLSKWQDDLDSVLDGNKPENEIIKACNYNTAGVPQPKDKWYMLKDAAFLLRWCNGVMKVSNYQTWLMVADYLVEEGKLKSRMIHGKKVYCPPADSNWRPKAFDNAVAAFIKQTGIVILKRRNQSYFSAFFEQTHLLFPPISDEPYKDINDFERRYLNNHYRKKKLQKK